MRDYLFSVLIILMITIITGCGNLKENTQSNDVISTFFIKKNHHKKLNFQQLIFAAKNETNPLENAKLIIEAADLIKFKKPQVAENIIKGIDLSILPHELQKITFLTLAEISNKLQNYKNMIHYLDKINQQKSLIQGSTFEFKIYWLRFYAYYQLAFYDKAFAVWITIMKKYHHFDIQKEHYQLFWKNLLHISYDQLSKTQLIYKDNIIYGWIDLAKIFHFSEGSSNISENLNKWQKQWGQHPTSKFLIHIISPLLEHVQTIPKKIALVLPLSGELSEAGQSIKNGFMSAFYQNQNKKNNDTKIYFFDTNQLDIQNIVNELINKKIDIIIGPLNKNNVVKLLKLTPTNIKILSLNYIEDKFISLNQNFYQFGLSIEDEANLIAQRMHNDNYRNILIVSSDRFWSQRSVKQFKKQWKLLGGEIIDEIIIRNDTLLNQEIEKVMLIKDSNIRKIKISRLLNQKVESSPYRRHDIDAIFMPLNYENSQQLIPILAYQYSSNIPTYATSSLYNDKNNNNLDQDLNGLIIPLLPWFTMQNYNIKTTIQKYWPSSHYYGELYALGADANALYPYLEELKLLTGSSIQGLTGELYITEKNKIFRNLSWYIYKKHQIIPMELNK